MNKRLMRELQQLKEDPCTDFKILSIDNDTLIIQLDGSPNTIYAGETFYIQIVIPHTYPIARPSVKFIRTPPINEHIYSNGCICISTLYDNWSPAFTIRTVILSITLLLSQAKEKKKPVDDKLMPSKKDPNKCKWWYHEDF